jgi:hypothetical protein
VYLCTRRLPVAALPLCTPAGCEQSYGPTAVEDRRRVLAEPRRESGRTVRCGLRWRRESGAARWAGGGGLAGGGAPAGGGGDRQTAGARGCGRRDLRSATAVRRCRCDCELVEAGNSGRAPHGRRLAEPERRRGWRLGEVAACAWEGWEAGVGD